jgi:hypothetical protein
MLRILLQVLLAMVGRILLEVSSYTARIAPEEGPPPQVDTYRAVFAASDASLHSPRHQMYPKKFGASTSLRVLQDVGCRREEPQDGS